MSANATETTPSAESSTEPLKIEATETQPKGVEHILDTMADNIESDLEDFLKKDDSQSSDSTKAGESEAGKEEAGEGESGKETAPAKEGEGEGVVVDPDKIDDEAKAGDPLKDLLDSPPPGGTHASAATQANWKVMQTALKEASDKVAKYEEEMKSLKAAAENAKPEVLEELNYLRQRVAEFDVAALPEFKQQFDSVINSSKTTVVNFLSKLQETGRPGLTKENITELQKYLDEDYINYPWAALLDQLETHKTITGAERKAIETQLGTAIIADQQRQDAIKQHAQKVNSTREERAKEAKEKIDNLKTTISSTVKEHQTKTPWLNPPKLPDKATPEQKKAYEAEVEEYNKLDGKFRKVVNTFLASEGIRTDDFEKVGALSPKEVIDLAINSFKADRIEKDIAAKDAEIKRLTAEINKFKAAGNTSAKAQGHRPTTPAKKADGPTKIVPVEKTATDTVESDLADFLKQK